MTDSHHRETDSIILCDVTSELVYPQAIEYLDFPVTIPPGCEALHVELSFTKVTDLFQLYAALLDDAGLLRGHVQCPGGPGDRHLDFWVTATRASPGCIPGIIHSGQWTLRLDLDRFRQSGTYHLRLTATAASGQERLPEPPAITSSDTRRAIPESSWLRGELHCHSEHSDGHQSVREIINHAHAQSLDFIAISDHYTWSHWGEGRAAASSSHAPLFIQSIEVTTHYGHANVHGLREWIDVYVDHPDRDGAGLGDDVHAQGGLLGINHPYSGPQAWRRDDIPWHQVDLLEVVNLGQDANNDAAIGLWDRLLSHGYDIAPVAGSDCHDITDPEQQLGQVVTAVHVAERSSGGVLAGLSNKATVVTRGSFITLSISDGSTTAHLGQYLRWSGDALELTITTDCTAPMVLFIIRDGLMWHQMPVMAGANVTIVTDPSPVPAVYRAELHRQSSDPRHWASAWRSHESFEALTSFIRVVSVSTPTFTGES